jgi:ferredoxin
VTVCPVACFHGDGDMLYIDPAACIECRACIPACPVKAIADASELPEDKRHWIAANEERARTLPAIEEKQPSLPTAEARRAALGFAA